MVLLLEIFRQIATLKNMIFDLYKIFLMGKENDYPDFELKKFQILPESYENFQKAGKNIEGLCVFKTLLSYIVCSHYSVKLFSG